MQVPCYWYGSVAWIALICLPLMWMSLFCGDLCCRFHVDINGEGVVRAYTPVSGDRDLGVLDFLIKVYWAGEHPQFPEGGKMTQHLAAMKVRLCECGEGGKGQISSIYHPFW